MNFPPESRQNHAEQRIMSACSAHQSSLGNTSTKHHPQSQQTHSNCTSGALDSTWLCMEKQLASSKSFHHSHWKAQGYLQCIWHQKLANRNQSPLLRYKRHKNSSHTDNAATTVPSSKSSFLRLQCSVVQSCVVNSFPSNVARRWIHWKRSKSQHKIQKHPHNTQRPWDYIHHI